MTVQPLLRTRDRLCLALRLFLAAWASALVPLPSPSAEPTSTNIVIGLLLPPEEMQSASVRDGTQLAIDQANATPGQKFSLTVRGRVGQWGADAVEAGRMVLDDGATALIAPPDGSASHLALQVSGRTAVPVVTLCPDSSVSTTGVPWFLRVVPRTQDEATVIFTNLNAGQNPVKRWIAVVPSGRPGRENTTDLKQAASSAGCVIEKVFELSTTNRISVMKEVIRSNPEGILLWLDPFSAGACARLLRLSDFRGAVAGPLRLHSAELIDGSGNTLEGMIIPGIALEEESQKRFDAFETVYRHQFKREPDVLAAFSFDAAALLAQILRGSAISDLPKSFPFTNSLNGVTGLIVFDANGNRQLPLRLLQVTDGRFQPVPNVSAGNGDSNN